MWRRHFLLRWIIALLVITVLLPSLNAYAGSTAASPLDHEFQGNVAKMSEVEKTAVKAIATKLAQIGLKGLGLTATAAWGVVLGVVLALTPEIAISK